MRPGGGRGLCRRHHFSEGFSSLLNTPTLTVGTPFEVDNQIVGAVLLHAPVKGMDDVAMQGAGVLAVSTLIALALSVVLSVFLALTFTKPLNKMKNSALKLAEGDYTAETGVRQKDEIGELAQAIDTPSAGCWTPARERKAGQASPGFRGQRLPRAENPVTCCALLEALCDGW
jgi:HAMP domain-containing protein